MTKVCLLSIFGEVGLMFIVIDPLNRHMHALIVLSTMGMIPL